MRVDIKNKKLFFNVMKSMIPNFNLQQFNGLTIDSRQIKPGDILVLNKIEDGYIDSIRQATGVITEENNNLTKRIGMANFVRKSKFVKNYIKMTY